MASEDNATNEKSGIDINLRDVPKDVVDELERRARANYRPRSGEILAILTAVCRGRVELPVSLYNVGSTAPAKEMVATAERQKEAV